MPKLDRTLASEIGQRVRERRIELKRTLKAVAERSGHAESNLSRIENGRSLPSLRGLLRLAQVLSTTPNRLLGWKEVDTAKVKVRNVRGILVHPGFGKVD